MPTTKGVNFKITATNKTEKVFSKIKSSVSTLGVSVAGLGAGLAGLAGIGAFGAMAKSAMDTGDRIHKLNLKIGASTEALSQYRHIANMSGVAFEDLATGFQMMVKNVSQAADGTGVAKKALEELNIDAAELNELAPEEQFEKLADAIMKVENPADRVRLAMDLFGRSGASLLQTMTGGSEGLQKMRDEADALGMTMSQDMATGIADANDSIQKVTSRVTSLVEQIMGSLAPAVTDIANEFGGWIDANRELISQQMTDVLGSLAESAKVIAPIMADIAGAVKSVGEALGWAMFKGWEFLKWTEKLSENDFIGAGEVNPGGVNALVNGTTPKTGLTGAAALAAAGGGESYSDDSWIQGRGATVVNNFNTQISRADAVAIASETARQANRQ